MHVLRASFLLILCSSTIHGLSLSSWKKSSSKIDVDQTTDDSSRRAFFRESFSAVALPLMVSGVTLTSSLVSNPLAAVADDAQSKVLVLGGSG